MLNKVILIGNCGNDPDTKKFDNGQVSNISLATTEKYKKDGQAVENTEWHKIVFHNKLSEIVDKYIKKGSKLYVEGKIKTRSYEKDGQTQYIKEIICSEMKMLDGKQKQDDKPESSTPTYKQPENVNNSFTGNGDDLPF